MAQITLVPTGSVWRYLDTGGPPGNGWQQLDFNDGAWGSGPAQLGYGDGDESTAIASVVNPKPITTYFRHTFVIPEDARFSTLTLRLLCDDGAVVHLNGYEVTRLRMPGGPIDLETHASATVEGGDESRFVQRAGYYVGTGTNVIAVELHQSAEGGDDASFDLTLLANIPISYPTVSLSSPEDGDVFDSAPIGVTAVPNDADGHIYLVQFYANSELIQNVFEEPFTLEWYPPFFGRYALYARAVDNSGRSTISPAVHVQYGNGLPDRITRGPYLQSGSTTSVVVRWRTDWFTDARVRYGPGPGDLTHEKTVLTPSIEHEVKLTGLSPGTRYYYSVGTTEELLAGGSDHFFVTTPVGAQPTRIWAIGDAGTTGQSQRDVRDAYYRYAGLDSGDERHTDVWLMLGDNAYESGTDEEYQRAVFDMYGSLLRRAVLWSTFGNHDAGTQGGSGTYPYFEMFTFPQRGESGGTASGTERYYSFDHGNIHFVCLDATSSDRSLGSPMLTWLEQDLAATSQEWIIAFWHQPPYTFGTHNSDFELDLIQMRQNVVPILEAYGTDLVLCGHSHNYERSYLISGHYGFSSSFSPGMALDSGLGRHDLEGAYRKPAGGLGALRGTVYVVCGCSGEGGFFNFAKHPAHAVNFGAYGSMVIDIDGLRLDARFLRETGEIQDYFSILKGAPPPGVAPALGISRLDGQVSALAWPTSLLPFRLQSKESLGLPSDWFPFPVVPVTVGRSNIVTIENAGPRRFFRLRADP